ncbi:hypothetical protein PGT21_015827 [Puccinia graminis f. sp. tritici]|nr:hypothetical protein PGT21_015827 [Puccinia graminis f. sp. tritici]
MLSQERDGLTGESLSPQSVKRCHTYTEFSSSFSANPSNCGKVVYIQKKDQPNTCILAKVTESCWFNGFNGDYAKGCSAIAVSNAVLQKLGPDRLGIMYEGPVVWDFVKYDGQKEVAGPV